MVLYVVPTTPFGNDVVVIFSDGIVLSESVTVMEAAGNPESVTLNVSETGLELGMPDGVPLMMPFDVSRESPAGSEPFVSTQL